MPWDLTNRQYITLQERKRTVGHWSSAYRGSFLVILISFNNEPILLFFWQDQSQMTWGKNALHLSCHLYDNVVIYKRIIAGLHSLILNCFCMKPKPDLLIECVCFHVHVITLKLYPLVNSTFSEKNTILMLFLVDHTTNHSKPIYQMISLMDFQSFSLLGGLKTSLMCYFTKD